MKKNIYIFLPTGKIGASSRYRVLQYMNDLEKNFNVEINEFLDDSTYEIWKSNKLIRLFTRLPYKLLMTIKFSLKIPRGSTVLIHRDIIPFGNMWIEKYLYKKKCKIIVDIDDAIFLDDTSDISNKKNAFLYNLKYGKRYDELFKISSKIICGNKFLQDYVKQFCEDTKIIPTVVDLSKIEKKEIYSSDKLKIGWIGNPGNTSYVLDVLPIIDKVALETNERILVNLIGSKIFDNTDFPNLDIEFNNWSLEKEYQLLKTCDIGIMPLKNSEWAKGKCALKLLQYMAVGIPVIGSDVGENKNVINNGNNGFLVGDKAEWEEAIKYFIYNKQNISVMGDKGRKFVSKEYSLDTWSNELVNYLS